MVRIRGLTAGAAMLLSLLSTTAWAGGPPAQKLPSAFIALPLVDSDGFTRETRIELLNLSNQSIDLECFWVFDDTCNEIGFFISLSPLQPLSWLASRGYNDVRTFSRVPPFFGQGGLRCAVLPQRPEIEFHNVLQGRAIIYGSDSQTVSYDATAFRRLADGDFTGEIPLDGVTYEQCPDKLHFTVLGDSRKAQSEIVLVPCTQDLLNQVPPRPNVSLDITNEFEQTVSAVLRFSCFSRVRLSDISFSLNRAALGSETAHLTVRGSTLALIGLAIDHFNFHGVPMTAGNDPSFEGGRTATVLLP